MLFGERAEVIVMKDRGPTQVACMLGPQGLAYRGIQGFLRADIGAHLAPEDAHRVLPFFSGTVIPTLDGRDAKAHRQARDRVLPLTRRELFDLRSQFTLRRRCGQ